jgi:hypothetical protein
MSSRRVPRLSMRQCSQNRVEDFVEALSDVFSQKA